MKFKPGDKVRTTESGYSFSKEIGTIIDFDSECGVYGIMWANNYEFSVPKNDLELVQPTPKYYNKLLSETIKKLKSL